MEGLATCIQNVVARKVRENTREPVQGSTSSGARGFGEALSRALRPDLSLRGEVAGAGMAPSPILYHYRKPCFIDNDP